jgi:NAD(P)-dependent dehydrogenase (short-subunit alcohol dehydrogenase family)
MELRDKVAVVTGGGSGIGEALAERFLAEGARHVVVADLLGDRATAVAERLGERASGVQLDVSDEAAIVALVEQTLERHGPIDLFVSNAGYGLRGGLEVSNEAIEQMWQVHTMSHIYAARAVLPSMIARGEGYLLNTASAAGLLTQMDSLPYAITKSAAVALGEWLAIAHHHQGIRVSVLCPQAVRTRIAEAFEPRDGGAGSPGVGQASQDGVLEPAQLAQTVIECLAAERFLVLPHPEVQTYAERKANDRDRWLAGMRRFGERLAGDRSRPGDWFMKQRDA